MENFKVLAREGYNDGYYWDMRFLFECDGVRYILIDVGSGSGYIPMVQSIMRAPNEDLDTLLKDWPDQKSLLVDEDIILDERFARDMIKDLVESGEDEYTCGEEQDDYE